MPSLVSLAADPARTALVIFALTYVVLGFGSLPTLRIDRTGATLIGATAMVGLGVLTPHEAVAAIDFHTLALLFGMMIVVAHLRIAGFFAWLDTRVVRWAHAPARVLVLTVWLSGAISALFVNDTACLLLTPLVLETALAMRRNPTPFLLAVAMGSNLGSVATIVGNPQNMLVASFSGISYARFAGTLLPVAIVGLAIASLLLALMFRRDLGSAARTRASLLTRRQHPGQDCATADPAGWCSGGTELRPGSGPARSRPENQGCVLRDSMIWLRLFLYPVLLLLALEFHHGNGAHPGPAARDSCNRVAQLTGQAPRDLKRELAVMARLDVAGTTAAGIGLISNR